MNSLEVEISFCEGLLRRDPDNVEVLQILGDLYTKSGLTERALGADERLTQLRPRDPIAFYNFACCCAQLGRIEEAFAALSESAKLGYADAHWLTRDADLNSIRADPRFIGVIDRVRQNGLSLS